MRETSPRFWETSGPIKLLEKTLGFVYNISQKSKIVYAKLRGLKYFVDESNDDYVTILRKNKK